MQGNPVLRDELVPPSSTLIYFSSTFGADVLGFEDSTLTLYKSPSTFDEELLTMEL